MEVWSINEMSDFACLKQSTVEQLILSTNSDDAMQELMKTIKNGWPSIKTKLPEAIRPYFGMRD